MFATLSQSSELWRDESYGRKADGTHWKLSVATGSIALVLLGLTLSIGPIRAWRRGRQNPIHIRWRRTIDIRTGIVAWVHVGLGITIHSPGWRLDTQFLNIRGFPNPLLVAISIGFWLGSFAAITLIPLMATSNPRMMRRLGPNLWKRVQRLTYILFGLLVVHIGLLQYQERRDLRHVGITFSVVTTTLLVQVAGVRYVKRMNRATSTHVTA